MKTLLSLMMTLTIHSYALGSNSANNIFTGKTHPTSGAAAVAVAIAVDESVLKDDAIADGKSQCYDAGFKYCYAINSTYDTVQDARGFYAKILVEGFHEIPEKYKPTPIDEIQPPAGSLCYFRDARGFTSEPIYQVYVSYNGGESAEEFNTFGGSIRELFSELKSQGVCESYRVTGGCSSKWFGKGYNCN